VCITLNHPAGRTVRLWYAGGIAHSALVSVFGYSPPHPRRADRATTPRRLGGHQSVKCGSHRPCLHYTATRQGIRLPPPVGAPAYARCSALAPAPLYLPVSVYAPSAPPWLRRIIPP